MSNHSVIEHRANYHYIGIEEDFLAICSRGECSPHCKALILAILEHWTNTKQGKDEGEYIYLTMPEWAKCTYMLYERDVLADCIKELMGEGLISRRAIKRYDQDTFEYKLELNKVNALIRGLPEKTIKETSPNLHPYTTFKDRAKAKRAKKKEENKGVGEKSRTPSKAQKGGHEKSGTVPEKSRKVHEKSTQHSIHTEITTRDSNRRSSASTQSEEQNNNNGDPSLDISSLSEPDPPGETSVEQTVASTSRETGRETPLTRSKIQEACFEDTEEQRLWSIERAAGFAKREKPNAKQREDIADLAENLRLRTFAIAWVTGELLEKSFEWQADTKGFRNRNREVGNTVTCLPDYIDAGLAGWAMPDGAEPLAIAPQEVSGDMIYWTRYPETAICDKFEVFQQHLHLFELMSVQEASAYGRGSASYGYLMPREEELIKQYVCLTQAQAISV